MNKTTLLAIAVFAALAAATIATLREKPERGITRISFAAIDPAQVDRVVVSGPNPIELKRDGAAWKAGDKPADTEAASALLDAVTHIQSSELTSRKRERYTELQVDDEKGSRVRVFGKGQTLADFVVGTSASGGTYIRVGEAVYLVHGIYPGAFSRVRSTWLDRRVFSDKADDVTRVEVALGGKPAWALVKQDGQWKPEDPALLPADERFDANAARALAQTLASVRALDVLDQDPGDDKTGLGQSADTLRYSVAGGVRELRLGGEAEGGSVYARANTRGDLLTVGESVARSLRKQPSDIRDWTILGFDPASATRLSILRDGKKLVFEKAETGWKIAESSGPQPDKFEFDPTAVMRRLTALSTLRAVAEADPTEAGSSGLKQPPAVATVTLADGTTVDLAFGNETKHGDEAVVFARGSTAPRIYLVRTGSRDNVLGGLDSFAKRDNETGFANLDPKSLEGLPPDVRAAVMKKMEEQKRISAAGSQAH